MNVKKVNVIFCLFILLTLFSFAWSQTPIQSSEEKIKSEKLTIQTNKEKVEAKKIVEQFIDGVFVERKTLATVERFMRLDLCDKVDEVAVLPIGCSLPKLKPNLGRKTISRIYAIAWRYGEGRYALQIGIYPITDSNLAYPYSAPNYETLKSSAPEYDDFVDEILAKNKSPKPEIEFIGLSKSKIKKRLDVMERDVDEIETLIYKQVNKSVFDKNIEIMKNNIEVEIKFEEGRTYYSIYLLHPDIGFILAVRKGSMKIIGLFDSV
jgi:hypothetical protein